MLYVIVQIGELVSQLSDEIKAKNRAIPWRVIKDMRNFYVHAYGSIDISSVWNTLTQDIVFLLSVTGWLCILIHFVQIPVILNFLKHHLQL